MPAAKNAPRGAKSPKRNTWNKRQLEDQEAIEESKLDILGDAEASDSKRQRRKTMDELMTEVPVEEFHQRHEGYASGQLEQHNDPKYDDDVFMASEFPPVAGTIKQENGLHSQGAAATTISLGNNVPSLPPPNTSLSSESATSVAIAAAAVAEKDPAIDIVTIGPPSPSFINVKPTAAELEQHQIIDSPSKHFEYNIPSSLPASPTKTIQNRYYGNVLPIRSPQKRQFQLHQEAQEQISIKYPPYFKGLCELGKQKILDKLAGRSLIKLVGLEDEYKNVYSLLEDTVAGGEGNSCLIVGPRSTGKTLMVDNAIRELQSKYDKQFITLQLSGFALGDDKMAVREMCRQIDAHLVRGANDFAFDSMQYESIEKKSISESLISLLSIFGRKDEAAESGDEDEDEDDNEPPKRSSSIAVIVVLEELDRFTQHSKQTLLYNLLDMAQSSKTPLAVVGVTPRMNTRELFEKRVRSRFSQRVIVTKRPDTMDEFWAIAQSGLKLQREEFQATPHSLYTQDQYDEYRYAWNESIDKCFTNRSGNLYNLVELIFYTTKDVRELYNRLLFTLTLADPLFSDFEVSLLEREQGGVADTQSFVEGLSELELSLLICAARVEIKYDSDTFNFNVVYDEYVKMAKELHRERAATLSSVDATSGYRIWSRDVARAAWEKLESVELVTYVEAGSNGTGTVFVASNNSNANGDDDTSGKTRRGRKPANSSSNGELTTTYAKPAVGSTKGAVVSDDIRIAKVDASLQEISNIIGNDHVLSKWTRM